MIFVRARNAEANLELLEDDSQSPPDWIVTYNGQICSVGSEGSARSQYSWLELLPRIKANALSEEDAEKRREQLAAWLKHYRRGQQGFVPKPKPKDDPDPEPDFGM